MASLDFPLSPTVGQQYTANGSTWTWDGVSWLAVNGPASGFSGFSGYSGFSGFSGVGLSGVSGISGYSGYSGIGFSGFSGYSGETGISGYSGYSGLTGPTVYPSSGVAVSTGSAWGSSLTATDANTASALVQRDASGNFSAGTIAANINGSVGEGTQNIGLFSNLGVGTASPAANYKVTLSTGGIKLSGTQSGNVTGAIDTQSYLLANGSLQYLNYFKANGLGGSNVSKLYGGYFVSATAASAYTTNEVAGVFVDNHSKGAGSTIGSAFGVYIKDQTSGTFNYGLYTDVSAGSLKYNIYAGGTAQNFFGGYIGVGSQPQDFAAISFAPTITTNFLYGIELSPSLSAGSNIIQGLRSRFRSSTGTHTSVVSVYAGLDGFSAGSTITTGYGVRVTKPSGSAGTLYGVASEIDAATNYWNIYASGTANNYFAGNVGIGTLSPTAKLDVSSDVIRLRTSKTPASASAAGNAGDIAWDSNYIYVCVATNTWTRAAINTW